MGEAIVLGTCSICGGAVTIPKLWYGTIPPVPICSKCGATKKTETYGPVIPMVPNSSNFIPTPFGPLTPYNDDGTITVTISNINGDSTTEPTAVCIPSFTIKK